MLRGLEQRLCRMVSTRTVRCSSKTWLVKKTHYTLDGYSHQNIPPICAHWCPLCPLLSSPTDDAKQAFLSHCTPLTENITR